MPHLMYPPKALMRGERGLNLVDPLQSVDPRHTLKSRNCYWFRTAHRRRKGFSRLSTESWSAALWRGAFEFLDNYGNSRLLLGRNGGTVEEWQSAAAHATVVTGLTAGQEMRFASAFGACFVANGVDALRRLDATSVAGTACTSRRAGIPGKVTGFTAAIGAAGTRTGEYAFMATAVIESGGVKLLESDWSDLVELTLTADAVTFGWTDPSVADSRVTHVYLYGTKAGGIEPYYITKVALPATALANNDTADAALGALAARRASKTTLPTAPTHVVMSGTRMVMFQDKTAYFSRPAQNSYDLEAIQASVDISLPGKYKASISVSAEGSTVNTNSLWVATDRACGIFFQTDPTVPQSLLSEEVGCVGPEAVARRGKGIFWVDKRRGVMWWPGAGRDIYCVSEKVNPIFHGGGNQDLTANQGDDNIWLAVWGDMLAVGVRDDSSKTGANKVYCMDLQAFERLLLKIGPENAAQWLGPWDGLGFHRLVPMADGGLTVLDNQNRTLLKWDTTTYRDYANGTPAGAFPVVRFGPALQETLDENKRLHHFYLFLKHGVASKVRVVGQEGQFDYPGITLTPVGYSDLTILDDLTLIDIAILRDSGRSEARMDWSFVAPWFQFEVTTEDYQNDWQLGGARVAYTRQKVMINV